MSPGAPRPGARQVWRHYEPVHQMSYRSAEGVAAMTAVGLDRPDLQYWGARLSAMGAVSAPVATALAFGYAPRFVAATVPEVWERASIEQIRAARLQGADLTLRRVLGEAVDLAGSVSGLARRAALACGFAGRPLAAAHLALDWPDDPLLELWWAATVLREERGDIHWAATTAAGLDGVECHVLAAANGYLPGEMLREHTGWTVEEWERAVQRLAARGLVDEGAVATPDGVALKDEVEYTTDRLAEAPLAVLSTEELIALESVLRTYSAAVLASGEAKPWRLREAMWREPGMGQP